MKVRLPEIIYVKVEKDGDSAYLLADTDAEGLVAVGDTETIGVYRRSETRSARGIVKFE